MNLEPNTDCHCPKARHEHGTQNMYLYHACRCTPCREAHATEARRIIRLQAYGRYNRTMQDPAPARDHIAALRANGITLYRIAELSGVSTFTIASIARNERPTITAQTAMRILSVKPTPTNANPKIVNGTGTARRLQALMTIGWTQKQLANMLNIHESHIPKLVKGNPVRATTARRVTELYDHIWSKPPKPRNRHERTSKTRTINYAKARGWLPPLAWDEDRIDDPAHKGYPKEVAA